MEGDQELKQLRSVALKLVGKHVDYTSALLEAHRVGFACKTRFIKPMNVIYSLVLRAPYNMHLKKLHRALFL